MIFLFLILVFFGVNTVHAQESQPSYVIELEQIEASPEGKINSVSSEIQKKLDSTGYVISPLEKDSAFTFSISDTNLDLSDLITEHEKTISTILKVNSPEAFGYQIIANMAQPLKSSLDEIIPQTTCNGSSECTPGKPGQWTDKNIYGWGYQISGPDVVIKQNDSFFRIFDEDKQTIFSQNDITSGEAATKLTVKVQVEPTQQDGTFTSVIKIISVPRL